MKERYLLRKKGVGGTTLSKFNQFNQIQANSFKILVGLHEEKIPPEKQERR
jgi:hypothetical protein